MLSAGDHQDKIDHDANGQIHHLNRLLNLDRLEIMKYKLKIIINKKPTNSGSITGFSQRVNKSVLHSRTNKGFQSYQD